MGDDQNLLAVTEILEASQNACDSEENAEDVLSWLLENLGYVLHHLVSSETSSSMLIAITLHHI